MQKKKKLPELFWHTHFSENLTVSSNYRRPKDPKTENRPEAPRDSIALVIRHRYMLNMLSQQQTIEKVIIEFSSEKIRSKFFQQSIFIPNNVSDLF